MPGFRPTVRGIVAAVMVCLPATPPSAEPLDPPRKAFHPVAIISIDGLRPDSLSLARSPNIVGLAKGGASTLIAETVSPSETLPAHVSMFTGETPVTHGVIWDEYRPQANVKLTTVFSAASERALQSVFVVGKTKLKHLAPASAPFIVAGRGDDDVANEAIVRAQLPFDILFVHFPGPDLVGHASGWMSTEYLNQITTTDAAVGRLLAALPAQATVILTADHGGSGRNHAEKMNQNVRIPWIISGPNVRAGHNLTTLVRTVDTAATVAHLTGTTLPPTVSGRVVTEAFVY